MSGMGRKQTFAEEVESGVSSLALLRIADAVVPAQVFYPATRNNHAKSSFAPTVVKPQVRDLIIRVDGSMTRLRSRDFSSFEAEAFYCFFSRLIIGAYLDAELLPGSEPPARS